MASPFYLWLRFTKRFLKFTDTLREHVLFFKSVSCLTGYSCGLWSKRMSIERLRTHWETCNIYIYFKLLKYVCTINRWTYLDQKRMIIFRIYIIIFILNIFVNRLWILMHLWIWNVKNFIELICKRYAKIYKNIQSKIHIMIWSRFLYLNSISIDMLMRRILILINIHKFIHK